MSIKLGHYSRLESANDFAELAREDGPTIVTPRWNVGDDMNLI
jgi:hypothetical protein